MKSHAPAPWNVKKLDANHAMIHDADGMLVVPRMLMVRGEHTEANARLIEAAPVMLALLQSAVYSEDARFKFGNVPSVDLASLSTAIRAVIAKVQS